MRRHQGLLRWLEERRDELDSETIAAIRANAVKKLVNATRGARSRREWDNFEELRSYLRELAEHPEVAQVVGEFTWPRWIYATKDRLSSLVIAKPGKR